ncbi:ATP-binding protein [Bacteroides cellulosilyticus]|uniref:ATP-binding protein n=1 Tax=Bacteroides cellulosilyticus TaxID=246787 RepID=UPI0032C0FF66
MERLETQTCNGDSTSFEKEMLALLDEQIFLTDSVFARLPMGVEIYDASGILRCLNERARLMYGVELDAVINKVNLFESPYVDEALLARIQSGDDIVLEFEYDFDRMNKEYFHTSNKDTIIYEVKIVPITNKQGTIVGHILLTNDVTSTKEAEYRTEESKKNLEMAMEAANMSSWVYDVYKMKFGILHGNSVFKSGMSLEQLLPMLHPQDCVPLRELFSRLINKEVLQGQLTVRVFNEQEGEFRHYESRMRLSTEHFGKLQIVGTLLDVTEKLRMAKKTQDLLVKRELAMKVNDIVHWDFNVQMQTFEAYNDPVNDYASDKLVSLEEYLNVIHPEDRSLVNDALQSMLLGRNMNINLTCRIQTRHDDTWQYCNITGVPFEFGEGGDVIRYTGFRQNISKLHQLNEELKERNYKMELTFKTVGMSYWDYDVKTRQYRSFNDPVNDFNPEKAIMPEDYLKAAHPEDTERVRENIVGMSAGQYKEFSLQYRSRTKWDQDWQTLIVTGLPSERDKKGNIIRYTGIAFNNTKWEKMAQELKEMKDKAELSDRLKSAFLANMSHEIRTPLNAIVGFSELLVDSDDPDEKKEYWHIIESNNDLLLRLINDILDLSKIESGIIDRKRERFNLTQLCNELYVMMRSKIPNADVELVQDNPCPECWIFLDSNRLKQVWMNFLTNAVKYTRSGYIRMGYSVEKDGIRFYVEDTGTGIPKELQDRVFGRFQKLNEFVQGTGLGLAISRAIVEAAGGEIGFTSEQGIGSTFWAWVPCEIFQHGDVGCPETTLPNRRPVFSEDSDRKLRILVAEDNDSNFLLVRSILKDYDLLRVTNGVEAVEEIRNGKFDFVLMDLKMPVMDGLVATRKIREFNSDIPIVALTANAFDTDRANAMDAGCNAFLPKPVKRKQLFELLSGACR